jgi:hypothetical protein
MTQPAALSAGVPDSVPRRIATRPVARWAWFAVVILALVGAAWMGRYKYLWHSNSLTFVLDRWTHRICYMGATDGNWFMRCSPTRLP